MTRAELHELDDLIDEMSERQAEQRAHLIAADTATDSVAIYVARQRAARCERRLILLERLIARLAA